MTTPQEPFDSETTSDLTPQKEVREEPQLELQPTTAPTTTQEKTKVKSSLAAGTWVALIVGLILLILLLVFIVQNQQQAEVNLFAWTWNFPAGVAYLLSAIIGALIMALVGGWRMLELRRQIRRARKS